MIAYAYATPSEKTVSGALALLMHALLLVMLVIGVSWQKRQTPPMVADLWSNLPPPPSPKVEAPPPPKVEPKPEPPKPIPKAEPKPAPKPVPKPDISLKEKKEKALKAKELAEKKKKEEQARLEALKQQQAKDAEAKRLREQEEALKKLAQQQAAARAQLVDEHKRLIAEHIKKFIIEPPSLQGNPEVELHVTVLVNGAVFEVKTRRASGHALWDSAVQRAVEKASPLPVPRDSALMREFRELNLKFRPKE
jgi:colicin import membrane protein